ncbi:hypothetical protein DSO57_1028979 [Entomophthora muscae]|uniref:Uncharacterized protein n=1 Tax=Entomophthora muscae TaxID=34485 RepID=A0ACC2SE87_9FUNG|nr:hypothetical protein DSO57_1028979 [Entomophthora muscae]
MSYIIKLAPILWWALPASSAQAHPKPPNASTYAWFPDTSTPLVPQNFGNNLLIAAEIMGSLMVESKVFILKLPPILTLLEQAQLEEPYLLV